MELSIDTAGEAICLCLSREGVAFREAITALRGTHTAELLPAIEETLAHAGIARIEIDAIAVCLGPGGYTGLRVGLSVAKGLALGLDCRLVGVPRFEAEAWLHRCHPAPVIAVHRASRHEYAWQRFEGGVASEDARIGPAAMLVAEASPGTLITGEVDEALASLLTASAVLVGAGAIRRPSVIAELAWRKLHDGRSDDLAALSPIYLREPMIGPQKTTGVAVN